MELDKRLENRADALDFCSHAQWANAVSYQRKCKELGLELPLSELLIELKGSTKKHRQQYLDVLLRELEPLSLIYEIDPLSLSMGSDWFLVDKAIETGAISGEKLRYGDMILKDLENRGIVLTMAEIFTLKGMVPESIIYESTACPTTIPNLTVTERKKSITLNSLCYRICSTGELLPPVLSIPQLSGRIIPLSVVNEGMTLQQEVKEKWDLDLTLGQILTKRYLIDRSLLHLLFLSQAIITKNEVCLYLGKSLVKELSLPKQEVDAFKIGREEARGFLAWAYRMSWLTFSPVKEKRIIEALEKQIGRKKMDNALKIQNTLKDEGFSLSLLKILALKDLKESIIMNVVSSELGVSPSTKKLKEPLEGPMPSLQLPLLSKFSDAEVSKILLKEGVTKEEELSESLLKVEDSRSKGVPVSLGEILIQRGVLTEQKLHDILRQRSSLLEETASNQEKRPSKLDLDLANLITNYKILPAVDLQRSLHLQSKLWEAGISKPLEEVLIQSRFLSPGMARDLAVECRRRYQKRVEEQIAKPPIILEKSRTQEFEKEIFQAISQTRGRTDLKVTAIRPAYTGEIKSESGRQKKAQRVSNIQVLTLFGLILGLFVVFVFAMIGGKKILTDDQPPIPTSTMLPIPTSKKTPEPALSSDNKTLSYKETYAAEMQRKGYVLWGSRWVTQKENEILQKSWPQDKEQYKLLLDVKSTLASYLPKEREIEIRGSLDSSLPTFPRPLVVSLYLLGPTNRDHVYIKRLGLVKNGAFEERIGPLASPLLPGDYGIQIVIFPAHQDTLSRSLIKWSQKPCWFISFQVGSRKDFEERYKEDSKLIENTISWLRRDERMLTQNPGQLSPKWFSKWWEELKELEKQFTNHRESAFIPIFDKTEPQILTLLEQLISWGVQMDLWIRRCSIFPPLSLSSESFALSLSEIESDFKIEKQDLKR